MKTLKYKLYKSDKNKHIHESINLASQIYNHCIALHKRYYRLYKKHISCYTLQKHITKIKARDKQHWNKLNSQAIQDITERIDKGYKKFFEYLKARAKGLKQTTRCSPPNFKKRSNYKSFTLKQMNSKIDDGIITIHKRKYKYFNSRKIDCNVKTVTIIRDKLGDIYIAVTVDVINQSSLPMTGKSAGFDFGLKTFLTSTNSSYKMVRPFLDNQKALKVAQRSFSKKIKGSNNRKKAKLNVARIHKKVANIRDDFHNKLTLELLKQYDILCFETLNMAAMKKLWGKKISDYAFSSFLIKLEAKDYRKIIIKIDRWYPSSKTCSCCGEINEALALKDREWTCQSCGMVHDRDINAAINIHRVGVSTLSLGNVRPDFQAIAV